MAARMIKVDIQSKNFGAVPVLGAIRFDVSPSHTVALVGPSGVGKSTLLRIISGIDPDFEGSVIRPENQAVVFQEPTLLPWRSTLENVRWICLNVSVWAGWRHYFPASFHWVSSAVCRWPVPLSVRLKC
jgi:ABC-type nitrate/sulfonate/bicarbonate transport system ATPase subunit